MKTWIILLTLSACAPLFAAVHPAPIFTDNTVLQQGEPVSIWGTADASETVRVTFAGQTKKCQADLAGKWITQLEPLDSSTEPRTLQISGDQNQVTLANVVVGEVWLAGGQSNMETTMSNYCQTTQPDIDNANDPLLRMVSIPRLEYAEQNQLKPQWQITTPENTAQFSASAYYFAKNLRESLGVPVGIIKCAVGGTPAEAWLSRKTLSSKPDLKRIIDAYDSHVKTEFKDEADYTAKAIAYEKAFAEFFPRRHDKTNRPPKPKEVMGPRHYRRPCGLYETMFTQTLPYTVRGVIWYQGEANANAKAGEHYRSVFSALIEEWRQDLGKPKLPFLFVQLATLDRKKPDTYWAELRDAQRWVDDNVPNTGMAVLTDGGEKTNIHPHSKPVVGRRLALLARNRVYGEKELVCQGPRLKNHTLKGSAIELTFTDTGSGLVLKPGTGNDFEICGADGQFVPARAELCGGKIRVAADGIEKPEQVRYGWKMWFDTTLYNAEGLPATPFRTDDFSQMSAGRYYLDNL